MNVMQTKFNNNHLKGVWGHAPQENLDFGPLKGAI